MPLRKIRRLFLPGLFLLLPLLLQAACSPAPLPPPLAVAASLQGEILMLRVLAPAAVEQADLTTPAGRMLAPERIRLPAVAADRDAPPRPSILLGGSAGSSSGVDAGIGLSMPMRNPFSRPRGRSVLSEVEFRLVPALLEAYRAAPESFSLYLAWGQESRVLPAPAAEAAVPSAAPR